MLTTSHSRLNHAVRKLEQAAASDRPTKLFGYESPSLLARTFNLGRRFNHRKQIQAQLEAVVQEAADVIKKTFPEFRTSSRNWGQYSFAEEMIAARPRHDDHYDGYIAYVYAPAELPFDPVETEESYCCFEHRRGHQHQCRLERVAAGRCGRYSALR